MEKDTHFTCDITTDLGSTKRKDIKVIDTCTVLTGESLASHRAPRC